MPTVHCQCGANYKVAAAALGKRARCKKCGQVFKLEIRDELDELMSLADLDNLSHTTT